MSDAEKKPQYFSNEDFEKVAADIISSPRRIKPATNDSMDLLFKIDMKQQEYYTKCFRHLMKTTLGTIDLNGALSGADERIVAFFKRSSLDVASLSKIWSLADVNEDGWLDLAEFSIAMHLVVLRVKGEIPIPDELPSFAKPPLNPPRVSSRCSGNPSSAPNTETQSFWNKEETSVPSTNFIKLTQQPIIKQFSDTPPLLVDSRPTAIKHSALLALKSPSGPPPIPPVRPQPKGHGRSASLDLKLIALNNGKVPLPEMSHSNLKPPNTLALWTTNSDSPSSTGATGSNLLTTSMTSSPQQPSVSTTTTNFASFPGTPDSNSINSIQPPPIPQRISPSPLPKLLEKPTIKLVDAQVQTEEKVYSEEEIMQFFNKYDSKLENLLGEEIEATEGEGVKKWSKRCETLRKQNAELEAERATLAQVRIQLEIRLQELEEKSKISLN